MSDSPKESKPKTDYAPKVWEHLGDQLLYDMDNEEFWVWTGLIWRRDFGQQVLDGKLYTASTLSGFSGLRHPNHRRDTIKNLRALMIENGSTIDPDDNDQKPELLNTPTCVVDLRTGGMLEGRKAHDRFTRITAASYLGADTPCPTWKEHIRTICCDEPDRIRALRSFMGYLVTGHNNERVMGVFTGPPATGKSRLVDGINCALGLAEHNYAVIIPSSTLLRKQEGSHTTELEKLRPAVRVASGAEIGGRRLNEEQLKQISGGDMISSRGAYGRHFTHFRSRCKIIATSNTAPIFDGDDMAMVDRIWSFQFTHQFVGAARNKDIASAFERERDGILSYLIGCAKEYLCDPAGLWGSPDKETFSDEAVGAFTEFATNVLVYEDGAWTSNADIGKSYTAWYEGEYGHEPKTSITSSPRGRAALKYAGGKQARARDAARERGWDNLIAPVASSLPA